MRSSDPTEHPAEETITLRRVRESDLPSFYVHQRDPEANRMAAFPPRDHAVFMEHWRKILVETTATVRAVVVAGELSGNVVCFQQSKRWLVGYWIAREFWGRGIATKALTAFLAELDRRPLHAYVSAHNFASIRVLEKCGFTRVESSDTAPDELLFELAG